MKKYMAFKDLFNIEHECHEVEIEVCNFCNAKCFHCPTTRRINSVSRMTIDRFENIIEKYTTYYEDKAKPRIIFAGGGEPLLNDELENYIQICRKNRFSTSIITNGQLLSLQRAKRLVESGLSTINVSVHAIKPDEYKKIMKLDFDVTFKNLCDIKYWLKQNSNQNVSLQVLCNESNEVSSTENEMKEFWGNLGIAFAGKKPIWNRAGNLESFDELICNKKHHISVNFNLPVWCLTLKYMDTIDTEGNFLKCSCEYFGDSEPIGNIIEDDLDSLYDRIKKILIAKEKPLECTKCIKSKSDIFFKEYAEFNKI